VKTYTPAQYARRQKVRDWIVASMPVILLIAFFSAAIAYPLAGPTAAILAPVVIIATFNLIEWSLIPRDRLYHAQRSHY
jgi:hypothetical protein